MAYVLKKAAKQFYQLVKEEGWEPTFDEIKEKLVRKDMDEMRRNTFARLLILRIRRKLKKEELYFYCVDKEKRDDGVVEVKRKYKLLTASREYRNVTTKLWKITDGFRKSCNQVLTNGMEKYPDTLRPLLVEFRAGMKLLTNLAKGMTHQLESAIRSEEENESSNK